MMELLIFLLTFHIRVLDVNRARTIYIVMPPYKLVDIYLYQNVKTLCITSILVFSICLCFCREKVILFGASNVNWPIMKAIQTNKKSNFHRWCDKSGIIASQTIYFICNITFGANGLFVGKLYTYNQK